MKQRYVRLSIRILTCIMIGSVTLYAHILKTNEVTAVQLAIPPLQKEVRSLELENERLRYEIDRFESPIHLMELLRKPEYSHLKFPYNQDVLILQGR